MHAYFVDLVHSVNVLLILNKSYDTLSVFLKRFSQKDVGASLSICIAMDHFRFLPLTSHRFAIISVPILKVLRRISIKLSCILYLFHVFFDLYHVRRRIFQNINF